MSRAIAAHHGAFGRAAVLELDHSMPMHAHREGHLIFYISGTPSDVLVAGQKFTLKPGHGVAISPMLPHRFELGAGDEPIVTVTLYINQAWFRHSEDTGPGLRFGRGNIAIVDDIEHELMCLYDEMQDGATTSGLDQRLRSLTDCCFQESWRSEDGRMSSTDAPSLTDNRIKKSIELMAENVAHDLKLDTIAREAGLSRPHFYRLFRENLGVTPNVYLNTLRAEAAIERLTTTDQAVTSIGLDLGFASQASFTRFFRANVGIPPTNYRQVAMFT